MTVERFTGSQTDAKPSVADLTGKEFFLAAAVAGGFQLAGLGGKVAGVISEGKPVGQHSSIKTGNQVKALAGTDIAVDAKVTSDAAGKLRVAAAGHHVFGRAKSAGADGELVTIEVTQEGILA